MEKACIACHITKNIEDFPLQMNHGKLIRRGKCKTCHRQRDAELHRKKTKIKNKFPDLPNEFWKQSIEYDRYEVSNKGRIRNKNTGVLLSGHTNHDGYLTTKMTYYKYKYHSRFIHRIVAKTWILNPNNYLEINHKDGNKLNNSMNNLEWCNRLHNVQHANKTGLSVYLTGTSHGSSKFTIDQINEFFNLRKLGYNYSKIARIFNVTHSTIRNIILRKGWKHLEQDEKGKWYESK